MKKSKLLLSIISLCFSLAVLTFGVFAANQVNYTISGNISYAVTDAYVQITTRMYRSPVEATTLSKLGYLSKSFIDNTQNTAFGGANNISAYNADKDYDLNTLETSITENGTYNPTSVSGNEALLQFGTITENNVTNTWNTYFVVVNIQNLSSAKNVWAKVTQHSASSANVVSYASNGFSKITNGETNRTIVFGFAIDDPTQNVANTTTFNCSIKIEAKDYTDIVSAQQTALGQALAYDSTSGLVTLNMGETAQSPVKWRLASIDGGATKYTPVVSNNALAEIPVGECVFVQETKLNNDQVFNTGFKLDTTDGQYYKATGGYDWSGDNNSVTFYEESGQRFLANDYFKSDIYNYLTDTTDNATNLYNALGLGGANPVGATIYNSIITRTETNLSKDMDVLYWEDDGWTFHNGNHTALSSNSQPRFWLLSVEETLAIIGGKYNSCWDVYDESTDSYAEWGMVMAWENSYYWLRSPNAGGSRNAYGVDDDGDWDNDVVSNACAVRAAFQLAL